MKRRSAVLCTVTLLACHAVAALAQVPCGGKPITWLVGYPPGGGSDFLARTVAAQMAELMQQGVAVNNQPGSAGMTAAVTAAQSPADGCTVLTADNGILIYNPALYRQIPYRPESDFAPLGLLARVPLVLVSSPEAGLANATAALIAIKSGAGKLSYTSPGIGSPHHLAMELLLNSSDSAAQHRPNRGVSAAMQEVMSGQTPLMVADTATAMAPIRKGALVPLLVFSARRLAELPEVPTARELGHKDVETYAWQGLVVPAATPIAMRDRLSSAMQAALRTPEVRSKLRAAGWDPNPTDHQLMAVYTMVENRKWHRLIRDRGITAE